MNNALKHLISLILVWFAFGIAMAAIAGHFLGQMWLAFWLPGAVPMAVSTAAAIISLAISMIIRIRHRHNEPAIH